MLINILIFLSTCLTVILLIRFSKNLDKKVVIPVKPPCNFKISKPKFTTVDNKKYANYSILLNDNHYVFFVDFPILFKFYSNENFKTKVKISYRVPKDPDIEEILNKEISFSEIVKEHKYLITDIIMGKINIEIELNSIYGRPVIGFEILSNDMCEMVEPCKIEIKFPE